jgi:hypothetical protein
VGNDLSATSQNAIGLPVRPPNHDRPNPNRAATPLSSRRFAVKNGRGPPPQSSTGSRSRPTTSSASTRSPVRRQRGRPERPFPSPTNRSAPTEVRRHSARERVPDDHARAYQTEQTDEPDQPEAGEERVTGPPPGPAPTITIDGVGGSHSHIYTRLRTCARGSQGARVPASAASQSPHDVREDGGVCAPRGGCLAPRAHARAIGPGPTPRKLRRRAGPVAPRAWIAEGSSRARTRARCGVTRPSPADPIATMGPGAGSAAHPRGDVKGGGTRVADPGPRARPRSRGWWAPRSPSRGRARGDRRDQRALREGRPPYRAREERPPANPERAAREAL